jgi:DNA-binding MarR family transcriptional regulator
LAVLARVEQPSMAQLLTRMDRDGLIRRTPTEHDRRVSLISLTENGLAKLAQVSSALFETNDQALRGFSAEEVDVLVDLLKRLLANLEENPADASDPANRK